MSVRTASSASARLGFPADAAASAFSRSSRSILIARASASRLAAALRSRLKGSAAPLGAMLEFYFRAAAAR